MSGRGLQFGPTTYAESGIDSGQQEDSTEPSDGYGLFDQLREQFRRSADISHPWRLEARMCYDFVSGQQWSEEDAAEMKLKQRPIVTFNRVASVVDSVSGLEVSNRQEVRYIPRQVGASGVNELLTSAAKWVRDECNAEDEESDAFMDCIICGESCTETRLDYDEDPNGKLVIQRVDPLELYWDASSRRRNRTDARHVFRVKEVAIEDAEEMFPDESLEDMNAQWASDMNAEAKNPHDAQQAPYYRNDQSPDVDKRTTKIKIVEAQWWELEKAWRVVDPQSGQIQNVSESDYRKLKSRVDQLNKQLKERGLGNVAIPLIAAPMKRRKYWRAFLGSKVLKKWDGPAEGGFTYKAMTGKRDRNHGTWFGLVRAMIDPQKWANKWLAQVMFIINTNAKGGILAEADAFDNPQEAMDNWSDPSAVTLVSAGALASGKILPKTPVQYPEGIDRLMQFAISSIRDVSGVNLELLGMAAQDQPGVLEHQRKQAGMTILAGMFDSLRHYRKDQGKLMLWYITNFLSDGRLIKIGGDSEAQYVPLVHQPDTIEYDVIVDDTPSSPNQKEQTWAFLVQLFPVLTRLQMPPQILLSLLKYSPLPASLLNDINKTMEQQAQQGQQQDPKAIEAQAKAQGEQVRAQAEAQTEAARAQWHLAEAQATMARHQGDTKLQESEAFANYAKGMQSLAAANSTQMDQKISAVEALMGSLQTAHDMHLNQTQQEFDQEQAQKQAAQGPQNG